jgi:hypothetical protein
MDAKNDRRALERLPFPIQDLHGILLAQAPKSAIGYRLGMVWDAAIWWFPVAGKSTRRWKTGRSIRGYFRLRPFEPPIIPGEAKYGVVFVAAGERSLGAARGLHYGIELAPLPGGFSCSVEEGERHKLRR